MRLTNLELNILILCIDLARDYDLSTREEYQKVQLAEKLSKELDRRGYRTIISQNYLKQEENKK